MRNEREAHSAFLETQAGFAKWFGNQDKVYAKASHKKGRLTIHGLVKAQPW